MAKELIITVENVTPIFLGGANPGALAETVRPASIRGQVRYWLRAMIGRQTQDPSELKRREGLLMGDTQAGSPVRFRVHMGQPLEWAPREKPPYGRAQGGRMMLLHRAVEGDRDPLASDAFLENQQFDLILSPRPGLAQLPDEVVAATLLWLHLGGLGKRARRGFGSLELVAGRAESGLLSEEAQAHLPGEPAGNAATLRGRIAALLNWIERDIAPAATTMTPLAPFPILHPDVCGVRLSDAVGRPGLSDYYEAMVPFWKESLRNRPFIDDRAYGYVDRGERRASPFHLHIARSAQGYHLVLTTFWSQPSPNGAPGWTKMAKLLADCETRFGATNLWGKSR